VKPSVAPAPKLGVECFFDQVGEALFPLGQPPADRERVAEEEQALDVGGACGNRLLREAQLADRDLLGLASRVFVLCSPDLLRAQNSPGRQDTEAGLGETDSDEEGDDGQREALERATHPHFLTPHDAGE